MPVLAAATALACPDCAPVRAARAAVAADPGLWLHVLGTLAPFVVLAIAAGALHRTGAAAPAEEARSCRRDRQETARSSPPGP